MVFSSLTFVLLFLPLTLFLYFLPLGPGGVARSDGYKDSILLVVSLLFYAWGEGIYFFALVFCLLMNWAAGLWIAQTAEKKAHVLALSVGANLLFLCYFKYAGFIFDNVILRIPFLAEILRPHLTNVHLPIGVSFFTFQGMSYVVDVYRGDVKAQPNIFKFGLFKSFFPQLIAGPIVRYRDIAQELESRRHTVKDFSYGIQRFICGLAQKVIFANTLGEVADRIFAMPISEVSTSLAWIAAIAYSFQIYYDFCGYSNMAIGMARMFGFRFLENFDYPYISRSITEFWRRWHISLSTWFRDYVYIPLGGSREGRFKTYRNLVIVFLLCGLWHGASWSFVLWGALHGALLIFERTNAGAFISKLPAPLQRTYTLTAVLIGWVFFRVESVSDAFAFLSRMFAITDAVPGILLREVLTPEVLTCAVFAAIFAMPIPKLRIGIRTTGRIDEAPLEPTTPHFLVLGGELAIFICSLGYLAAGSFNPFIYFRF